MRKQLFSIMIITILAGCATEQKPAAWSAIGGSRCDATIKLGYSYTYEVPNPDMNDALRIAKSRCEAWGYASAELFGGENKVCNGTLERGLALPVCNGDWMITKEFQCTGQAISQAVVSHATNTQKQKTKKVPTFKAHKNKKTHRKSKK